MSYLTVGDISRRTHSCFVWRIPHWIPMIEQSVYSPEFICFEKRWRLEILRNINFRFIVRSLTGSSEVVKVRLSLDKGVATKYNILDGESVSGYGCCLGSWYNIRLLQDYTTTFNNCLILCCELSRVPDNRIFRIKEESLKHIDLGTGLKRICSAENGKVSIDEGSIEDFGKLSSDLKDLFISGKGSDVTFYVQDRQFKAHKIFLQARLPFFDAMFTHDMKENKSCEVTITDCVPEVFERLLTYLYSGKIENVSESNVPALYQAADKYGISEVKEKCVQFMMNTLSVEVFCDVMAVAFHYKEITLIEKATDLFVTNAKEIISGFQWMSFMKEYPVEATELSIKALNRK